MNLRALRMFVATAEAGGLGHASARLHLSQPAASRQLQVLESELGVPLFHRTGRQLTLTPEGADLLHQSHELLTAASLLLDRARALRGGHSGTLKVAATPHVIASVLAPFLRQHQVMHPEVEVQLVEGGGEGQPDRLIHGEVQLAIMPSGDSRFPGRLLYPVHCVAVFTAGHALARGPTVDVAELVNEPFLLLRREFGSRRWFEAACEIAQFTPRIRLESAASQTLVELARVGYGTAIVPSTAVPGSPDVVVVPLVQGKSPLGRWSVVGWNGQRSLPAYARQFVNELTAHTRLDYPGKALIRRSPRLSRPKLPAE